MVGTLGPFPFHLRERGTSNWPRFLSFLDTWLYDSGAMIGQNRNLGSVRVGKTKHDHASCDRRLHAPIDSRGHLDRSWSIPLVDCWFHFEKI